MCNKLNVLYAAEVHTYRLKMVDFTLWFYYHKTNQKMKDSTSVGVRPQQRGQGVRASPPTSQSYSLPPSGPKSPQQHPRSLFGKGLSREHPLSHAWPF